MSRSPENRKYGCFVDSNESSFNFSLLAIFLFHETQRTHRGYLGIDARYFTPQDVHVSVLALGATFFLAVDAEAAVTLLGTNAATFHGLAAGRVRQLSCDLDVQLQESLEGDVGRERLDALRRDIQHTG